MNQKHLDKIIKCLELSKSSNPNEAANALEKARKLMRKYGFTESDIEFIEMGETTSRSKIQKKPAAYVSVLIANIANVFEVVPLLLKCRAGAYVEFVGVKEGALVAAYTFDVLYRKLMTERKKYLSEITMGNSLITKTEKTARADRYCEGWVMAVDNNIKSDTMDQAKKDHIHSFIKHRNQEDIPQAKTTRRTGGQIDDYIAGGIDGKDVRINTPVNGNEQHKLGMDSAAY